MIATRRSGVPSGSGASTHIVITVMIVCCSRLLVKAQYNQEQFYDFRRNIFSETKNTFLVYDKDATGRQQRARQVQAHGQCVQKQQHAHLPTIETRTENTFIHDLLMNFQTTENVFWIGLNTEGPSGLQRWLKFPRAFLSGFSNWENGNSGDYTAMRRNDGKWVAYSDKYTQLPYICEYPPDAICEGVRPCYNGGQCSFPETASAYQCSCVGTYTGYNCQQSTCDLSDPCSGHGQCTTDRSRCNCAREYHGRLCEIRKTCLSNPCQNGGTCKEGTGQYTCNCTSDYFGAVCSQTSACFSSPCVTGRCVTHGLNSFQCECDGTDRQGARCENLRPCLSNPCSADTVCEDLDNGQGYVCRCSDESNVDVNCGNVTAIESVSESEQKIFGFLLLPSLWCQSW